MLHFAGDLNGTASSGAFAGAHGGGLSNGAAAKSAEWLEVEEAGPETPKSLGG